jgi:isocitrate lyase
MAARSAPELADAWAGDPRWKGIQRSYRAEDVVRLRGSVVVEHTLARLGAERLWKLLQEEELVHSLGAVTGNQAVEMVEAGLPSIYVSGWQVAGDVNLAGETYPDQSLYPSDSAPALVRRINNALQRADQIEHAAGRGGRHWLAPIVAAAGVHYEDQLSSAKKCGHMGGKVLVPVREFIEKLVAARLAADLVDVPTLLVARTDANSATLLTSDVDERDRPFLTGERTPEGFFRIRGGLEMAIERAVAYAPYADLLWCETAHPDLEEARRFAEGVHRHHPGKLLAYNCSPSFNWRRHLDEAAIARFQRELASMGYRYQFVTLAGFHALNLSMFELAAGYHREDMAAYAHLQDRELARERDGYRAVKHQTFVGAGYFDDVAETITGGQASTGALHGSTEEEQFLPGGGGERRAG